MRIIVFALLVGITSAIAADEPALEAGTPHLLPRVSLAAVSSFVDESGTVHQLIYKPDGHVEVLDIRESAPSWWRFHLPEVKSQLDPGAYRILEWKRYNTLLGQDYWVHLANDVEGEHGATLGWFELPHTEGGVLDNAFEIAYFEPPPLAPTPVGEPPAGDSEDGNAQNGTL